MLFFFVLLGEKNKCFGLEEKSGKGWKGNSYNLCCNKIKKEGG